jgi:hypothetical protein
MQVALMPLGRSHGRGAILIHQFPVVVARTGRKPLTPEACTVSPYHCRIDIEDGVLVVRDLGSKHGTYVNESRVREACLWPGSKLTVGLNSFFVCYALPDRNVQASEKEVARGNADPPISLDRAGASIDIVKIPGSNPNRMG